MGVCNCSMFCCTLLYVHSSIAIILMGKRELIALLNLSSWCLVMVEQLFLAVPRGCLQFVIVVFPDDIHLLFLMFFSVLECKKRKGRSHGKCKNGNIKFKICTEKRLNTSLKVLSLALTKHGRHGLFSFLSSLPISVLRNLELEANKLKGRANKLYRAALLTRCYVQHFLSPYIISEVNHKRHFSKILFINKGIEFIDLHNIFKDNLVILFIPNYFKNSKPLSFAINITNKLGLLYLTEIKL